MNDDIYALKQKSTSNDWETFKNNIFMQDNQETPTYDNSMFDEELFNEMEESLD